MAQPGNRLHLNMTRNRNVRTDIPVFLGTERGGMREWENARTMQVISWFLYQVKCRQYLMILKLQWLLIGFHFKAYQFLIFQDKSMEEITLNSNVVSSIKDEDLWVYYNPSPMKQLSLRVSISATDSGFSMGEGGIQEAQWYNYHKNSRYYMKSGVPLDPPVDLAIHFIHNVYRSQNVTKS